MLSQIVQIVNVGQVVPNTLKVSNCSFFKLILAVDWNPNFFRIFETKVPTIQVTPFSVAPLFIICYASLFIDTLSDL